MIRKFSLGNLVGLGFLLALAGSASAQMPMEEPSSGAETQFRRIEQPLALKVGVTAAGVALIGVELWWFLFSKTKAQQADSEAGVQEITVTVDGGYNPDRIRVGVGQPVRLKFLRHDPSSCLEKVLVPDFHIAQDLPLNQTTPVEFTPQKPGSYPFTCGMNMFRGVIEVQAGNATTVASTTPQPMQNSNDSAAPVSTTKATATPGGIQEATITVDKGYQPKRVLVEAGQPVCLHFQRKNLSECYDQLLIPDFAIAVNLAPEQTTTVKLPPMQPGEYEFMCGMRMNHGVIEVRLNSSLEQKVA